MTVAQLENISMEHPILFYDGVCNFCSNFVQFIIARDHEMKFRFCPLQNEQAKSISEGIQLSDNYQTVIVLKDKIIYTKSDVTFLIIEEIGGLWRVFSVFKLVPKFIRDWFYDLLAKNRYSLFGKKGQCHVPSKLDQMRFL